MSFDPFAIATVPADEQWDETLDVLAQAAAREMGERGLLREQAEDPVRYHIRGFARRLVYPLLDQVNAEIRASQREAIGLQRENSLLRARIAELSDSGRARAPLTAALGGLWTLLVLAVAALLFAAWSGAPRPAAVAPPAEAAVGGPHGTAPPPHAPQPAR